MNTSQDWIDFSDFFDQLPGVDPSPSNNGDYLSELGRDPGTLDLPPNPHFHPSTWDYEKTPFMQAQRVVLPSDQLSKVLEFYRTAKTCQDGALVPWQCLSPLSRYDEFWEVAHEQIEYCQQHDHSQQWTDGRFPFVRQAKDFLLRRGFRSLFPETTTNHTVEVFAQTYEIKARDKKHDMDETCFRLDAVVTCHGDHVLTIYRTLFPRYPLNSHFQRALEIVTDPSVPLVLTPKAIRASRPGPECSLEEFFEKMIPKPEAQIKIYSPGGTSSWVNHQPLAYLEELGEDNGTDDLPLNPHFYPSRLSKYHPAFCSGETICLPGDQHERVLNYYRKALTPERGYLYKWHEFSEVEQWNAFMTLVDQHLEELMQCGFYDCLTLRDADWVGFSALWDRDFFDPLWCVPQTQTHIFIQSYLGGGDTIHTRLDAVHLKNPDTLQIYRLNFIDGVSDCFEKALHALVPRHTLSWPTRAWKARIEADKTAFILGQGLEPMSSSEKEKSGVDQQLSHPDSDSNCDSDHFDWWNETP